MVREGLKKKIYNFYGILQKGAGGGFGHSINLIIFLMVKKVTLK